MTSANFIFVMCDVCQMPSLPSAKFSAEYGICRVYNFGECWILLRVEFLKCSFFWVPSLPHAEFFRVQSFSDCWGPSLPRAEFRRMPDFAVWQGVEGCLQWNLNHMSTFITIETLSDSRASVMLEIKRAFLWWYTRFCFYMDLNLNFKRLQLHNVSMHTLKV